MELVITITQKARFEKPKKLQVPAKCKDLNSKQTQLIFAKKEIHTWPVSLDFYKLRPGRMGGATGACPGGF